MSLVCKKRVYLLVLSTEFPMSLVYVIIEGNVEAIGTVERAMANGIPVIIAKVSVIIFCVP